MRAEAEAEEATTRADCASPKLGIAQSLLAASALKVRKDRPCALVVGRTEGWEGAEETE